MVEIVTSSGLGLQESSASVLGSRGRVGSGRLGQDELRVAVNAVNGNLVIQGQDEVLLGVGLDESVFNTYNSQGTFTANGWQESYQRHVGGLTGTVNTTGSTITHYASDGSAIVYTYNGTKGVYVGNELGGANDTLSFNSTTNRWSWTDGQSRSIEVYDNANGGRLLSSSDADGNLLSYSYTGSQLTRITTANGEYTDFSYTGSLLTALVTSYTNASGLHSLTRVRYGYDGSNRLTTVSVDLSPQDNVVTDGKVYVTSYGYDGTSNRISSITQKDSDGVTLVRVDVAYVQVGSAYAVSTVTQATLNNTTTSTTSLSYNVANRRTTITDALGNQSVMVYDTSGRLTQLISPPLVSGGAQQAESFVYNSNGNLLYSGPTGDPNFTNIGLNWNDLYQSSNTVSTTQSTEVDGGVNVYRRQSTTTPPSGWVMRLGQSQQAWAAVSAGQTVNLKAYVSSTGASQIRLYAIFRDVNGAAISSLALNFPSVGGVFGANGVASANLASGSAAVPAGAAYVELVFQAIADGTGPLNVAIAQPSVAVGGAPVAGSIPPAYNYAYDGNGNRISMTDALGNQTLYTYDPNNNQLLTATEYADASTPMTTRYVYDGESHLVYTISPLGAVTKYIYNAAGQQTSVIEYTAAAHFYDVSSLSTSTSPALQTMNNWSSALTDLSTAKRTDMVYDARGALSSVTTYAKTTSAGDGDTSTASTTTYVYDQAGLLLSKVLPGSSATEVYLYDGLGRTLSFTDFNGKITQSLYSSGNGYDDNGSYFEGAKVVTTMANGTIQTSLYDLAGDLKKVTVSGLGGLISSTTYTYDRLSRLVKTTDATGLSNYFVYDAQGHKVADVDADGSLTVYRYNANDQIISTTSYATRLSAAQITSLGSVTESTTTALSLSGLIPTASASDRWGWNVYDFDGRLVETIDATGAVTAYIYDKASHLLSTTSYATLLSAATVTGFKTMAPASAVLPTADATNDRVVRNLYNIDGQLVGVLDADGYLTQTVYDEAGQSVKTIRYATQAASNLWATGTFADLKTSVGTSTSDIHNWSVYDNAGLLRAVVDGEGNVTRYDNYTGAGSVGKVTRGLWANPATLIATPPTFATLETSGTAPEITTYTYDQYGHVLTQSLALSDGVTETTTYSYDSSYNLIKQSTASISSATGAADGRTSTVRYDSLGRKVAQLSGVGSAALANLGANPTQAQIDGVWAQYQESYAYDAAGRLISQTDPNGNRTLFYYNSDGQLAYQIDATGAVVGYSYNAFGEKTDVTAYATKLSTTVLAGLVGGQVVTALTSAIQTSAQDSHSHVDFNIDGTVADTIDALGVTTNYAYNAFGEMTGRTDPVTAGVVRTTSKTYSRRGLLMSSTADVGGLALTTSYQYDAFGRTTQVTDPAASVRKTTYDRAGHVLTQVDALNQSTVFTYDSLGHVLTVTDRTGAITRYFYTKLFDRQVTVSDDAGSTIKTVNAYGETVKVVDGVGTITTYSYDADGHVLTQVVDNKSGGLNLTTQYTYDNVGNLISMTDPVGAVTRYIYDGDNRQTYVIAPTGAVTGYIYDALGQVVQSTRYGLRYTATGVQSKSTLDTWTSTTALPYASSDRITRAAYDVAGRLAYELDELGGVTAYVYDAEGRVLQSIQYAVRDASLITATTIQSKADMDIWASGHVNVADIKTRSVYDAGGRLSYAIDGTGAVTRYVYDGDGRVLQSTQYAVRDASLNTTTTIQSKTDMDSWASSHADAINDRVTRSVYDAEGRQVYSIDAMGVVTSYVYDAEGRVLKSTSYAVAYGNAAYELAKAAYQVALGRLPDYAGWMNWGGALDSGSITQPDFVQSVVSSAEFINKTSKLVNNVSVRMTNSEIVEYLYNAAFGRTSSGDATAAGYVTQLNNGTLTVANLVLTLAQSSESQAREAKLLGTKYAALLPIAPAGSLRVTQAVYDAVGRLSYSIDAMGAVTRYVYDAEGRVLQKIDYAVLKGPTTTIQSKTDMDTWAVTAANAVNDRVTRSVYDAAGRLSYSIDALGAVTKYTYDGAGKVTSSLQYGVLRTVPNTLVDIPSKTTMDQWVAANANAANDHQTVTAYDIGTRTTTITTTVDETRSTVTKVVYNIFGEKQDVTVAFGTNDAVTTHWGYYRTGWIASQATAYGTDDAAVVSFTYDAFGNKKTVTEGNGNATTDVVNDYVTTYSYDKEGRVLTKTEPTGALTVNTYNAFGDLVKVTDPNNNSGYFYYDVLGRKTWQVDPQGYVTKTTYDNSGNILSTTRYATALNNASDVPSTVTIKADKDNKTTFTRDGEGRVLTSTDGENNITSYVYNAFGDRISMTNATGHTVTYSYDVRGLMLSQVTPKTEVDGVQIAPATTTAYVYDGFGNRTQMIEAQGLTEQRTTTYVYDKNNQLTSQIGDAVDVTGSTSTVMPTQSFTYDLRGNQTSATDANGAKTVTYYDRQDRVTAQVNALGGLSTWSYDKNGNLLSQRVYGTALSLPVSTGTVPTPVNASNVRETKYTYDQANRRLTTSLVGAVSGKWVSDANPWVSSTNDLKSETAYDNNGNVIRETDANGNSTYYYYDKLGRKTAQIDPSGYLTTYTLDAEGNVTLQVQYATALSGTFTGGATPPTAPNTPPGINDRVTSFVYNNNGQRESESRSGVTYSTVTGNTIATTTDDVTIQFEYNSLGQVTKKIEATGDTTTYLYDDFGRVARMTTATGAITQSTYDGLGNLLTTVAGFGTTLAETTTYVYGDGGRLATMTDAMGFVTSYGYDANGNTTVQSYTRLKSDGTSVTEASLTSYNRLGQVTSTAKGTWNGTSYVTGDTTDSYYNLYGEVVARGVNTGGDILKAQEYADYDAAGRVWRSNMGDGIAKIYGYDAGGNTTVQIQGLGATDLRTLANLNAALSATGVTKTYNIYNGRNELVTVKRPTSVNVDGTISSASTVGAAWQGNIIVEGDIDMSGLGNIHPLTAKVKIVLPCSVVPAANSGSSLSFLINGVEKTPISSTTSNGYVTYIFDPINAGHISISPEGEVDYSGLTVANIAVNMVSGGAQTSITTQIINLSYDQLSVVTGIPFTPSVAVQSMNPSVTSLQMFVRPSGSTTYTSVMGTQMVNASGQPIAGSFSAVLPPAVTGTVWEVMYLAKDALDNVLDAKSGTVTYVGTSPITPVASDFKATPVFSATNSNGSWQLTTLTEEVRNAGYSNFSQSFNAFGDTLSQTDSRGGVTNFSYNVLGNLIQKSGPQVSVMGEDGVATLANPTDIYYYDKSGRLVGHKDANGNLTTQTLLAGSGYGGEAALITAQYNPDSGIVSTQYDVFGNAIREQDAVGLVTNNTYDKNNRLVTVSRTNTDGSLTFLQDYYSYDNLGQRIKHTNNVYGASVAETTDYDLQGRVIKSVTFGGQITTYGYVWTAHEDPATSRVSAGEARGGYWTRTVTANAHSSSVSTDDFGKVLSSTDLGGHVTTYSYNLAGQVTHQASTAGQSIDYSYTTTGQLARLTDNATKMVSSYAYDVNGNRILEAYNSLNLPLVYENAVITYDALNRVTEVKDAKADITYAYDANGNRREVKSVYAIYYTSNGAMTQTQDYLYKYDSMNRFIQTKLTRDVNGAVIVNAETVTLTYNTRGDRMGAYYGVAGAGGHAETYTYSTDGYLKTVSTGEGKGVTRGTDLLGRLTSYTEYQNNGASPILSRAITYDNDNRVTTETDLSYNNSITYTSTITNDYRAYIAHEVISTIPNSQGEYTETTEWHYDGDDLGVLVHTKNVQTQSGSTAVTTTNTDYNYVWWSQAKADNIKIDATNPSNTNDYQWKPGEAQYTYDVNGNLEAVNDKAALRKIAYRVDSFGQVMTRQETIRGDLGAERTFFYLNGRTIGDMGTDRLASSIDYAQQLADDLAAATSTVSAETNATPVVGLNANFDASYVAYNASTVTQAGSSYTVNDGDTLASIALSVWGDASLWYVIADANGLEADANLVAGQSLSLPDKVVNLHNTSQTFKPYNPNDALGDTTPTLPKEPQPPAPKKQGCGVGQIIVAIIAIAVTAIVMPAALSAVSGQAISTVTLASVTTSQAILGGAIAGAAGSIVSQGFAVATGIQSKFNWAAVATAAIGGGVGGAFAGTFSGINSPFLEGMVRGAVSNVVTQGVSMAVGLQKKFDWTSVAVAGVASGVANSVAEWAHGPQKEVNGTKQYDQRGKPVYEARQVGEFTENVLVGTASLLASAATKSLITGQDFGKSIREALPDAIASTVGNMIGEALKAEIQDSKSKRASELKIKPKTADDDPVLDTEKLGPSQYFDVDTTMPELPTLVRDGGVIFNAVSDSTFGSHEMLSDDPRYDRTQYPIGEWTGDSKDLLLQTSAATAPAGGLGGNDAWTFGKKLANGSWKWGEFGLAEISSGSQLLQLLGSYNERQQVIKTLDLFGLDATSVRDVQAARAYLWADYKSLNPLSGANFTGSGKDWEREAGLEAVMRIELANPGIAYHADLALQGSKTNVDRNALRLLQYAAEAAIQDAGIARNDPAFKTIVIPDGEEKWLVSVARPAGAPDYLQANSKAARAAVAADAMHGSWQGHHLIPAASYGNFLDWANAAYKAGWLPNGPSNIIALPADPKTQEMVGYLLPMHSGPHGDYNSQTTQHLRDLITASGVTQPTPKDSLLARGIFETVQFENRLQILNGKWHPRVH